MADEEQIKERLKKHHERFEKKKRKLRMRDGKTYKELMDEATERSSKEKADKISRSKD